jgi:hypothetical protein
MATLGRTRNVRFWAKGRGPLTTLSDLVGYIALQ